MTCSWRHLCTIQRVLDSTVLPDKILSSDIGHSTLCARDLTCSKTRPEALSSPEKTLTSSWQNETSAMSNPKPGSHVRLAASYARACVADSWVVFKLRLPILLFSFCCVRELGWLIVGWLFNCSRLWLTGRLVVSIRRIARKSIAVKHPAPPPFSPRKALSLSVDLSQ